RRLDGEDAVDQSTAQSLRHASSLDRPKRGGALDVEAQLHSRVRGVDGLSARPGRTTESPSELALRNEHGASHAQRTDHRFKYGEPGAGWTRTTDRRIWFSLELAYPWPPCPEAQKSITAP